MAHVKRRNLIDHDAAGKNRTKWPPVGSHGITYRGGCTLVQVTEHLGSGYVAEFSDGSGYLTDDPYFLWLISAEDAALCKLADVHNNIDYGRFRRLNPNPQES